MPYTPPSSRSPASTAPSSPDISRRSSFHQSPSTSSRPVLPRSASYMTKHRRTPSAPSAPPRNISEPSPESTSEDLKGMMTSPSVRQSPPPITGDRRMPTGAIISPPDSSSDDDDLPQVRSQVRGRQMDDIKALKVAISQIPHDRLDSPSREATMKVGSSADDLLVLPSQPSLVAEGIPHSLSTSSLDELAAGGGRRFSHARSATEPNLQSLSVENSLTASEEDTDEDILRKPQMVRKKSGELVRPALRGSSRRRPSSMPGTPTFSKAVHFDSHLEHVRHFLQVDRPLAWEIVMNNFPVETAARKAQPVQLERVWLSADQKCLIGSVAVANLAFQKYVTCRFTLDYWKTTSEVAAEYIAEILPAEKPIGRDRFHFTIKLSDLANLESKTLYFCIRYNVNGQEHWDNNGGMNFQADFRKKMLPQNGKKGVIGAASRPANGLPKSTRRANPPTGQRPKSMPAGTDDFGDNPKVLFDQSIHDYLGEAGPTSIRLKGTKPSSNIPSDNLPGRLSTPSGQAFANRYDFGASLTAAILNAKDQLSEKPDGLYMKSSRKGTPSSTDPSKQNGTRTNGLAKSQVLAPTQSNPMAGSDSPSAGISSSSYEELVNKYCFFGTKQSQPRFDGAEDNSKSNNTSTTSSYDGSPVQIGNYHHYHSGTQHHSLHPKDPNSYFHHAATFEPIGASPSESPIHTFSPQQMASPIAGPLQRSPAGTQTSGRSSPPAASVSSYAHFAGTSSNEYPYQHMHDRFPFSGTDAHTATAIRG
ncbi:putative phosphatase regulatory subunit-domain-containing protein [Cercophora newfieldiana]|uniref:Phosphatase regulatory subunit-domain-containing protein n=1 Tax=Cercophora newfieldiana TaxID=92897 RepID=A0AA39XT44_9PEZI|nr:putative phosphatase regulatory subunit-domain-containing protein [Cercophora newfieldiana]